MRIIPKTGITNLVKTPMSVDDTLKSALQRCFVTKNASRSDYSVVQALLKSARKIDAWLECDCKPELSAFIFPRKLQSGSYTVARPTSNSAYMHSKNCPFYSTYDNQEDDGIPDFNVLRDNMDNSALIGDRLFIILKFLLLQGSVCHYTPGNYYNYIKILTEVRAQLKMLTLSGSDLTLDNIVQSHDRYLISFLKGLKTYSFPENMPKQGLFWGLAKRVDSRSITLVSGKELVLERDLMNPSSESGPCWVIVLYTEASKGFYKAFHSLALPAYSETMPILLSHGDERPMFKQLLSVSFKAKKQDHSLVIAKHFNKKGVPKPGFTLTTNNYLLKVQLEKGRLDSHVAYDSHGTDKEFRESINNQLFKEGQE